MNERELIEWIRRQDPSNLPTDWIGPGDDCAVVTLGDSRLLVTTDQVLDGVHIQLAEAGPRAAGRKALARNLSDIAAMAGEPLCAVASVAAPKSFSDADAQEVYVGLREIGDAFNCPVVGGDVAIWKDPLAISVTVMGRPGPTGPVLRSGAKPGDAVCVTGMLGAAWKTGRDLTFTPRIAEARALAERYDLHAMIDISDGLATDLWHLCTASRVGAELRADRIPIHPEADVLLSALCDGEDYELLFTLPAEQADMLLTKPPFETHVSRIGTIRGAGDIVLVEPDGSSQPLRPDGWEHRS